MKRRFFRTGIAVAYRQLAAVLIMGLCTAWFSYNGQIASHSDPPHTSSTSSDEIVVGLSLATAIALADLFIAIGFVATSDAAIESAAGMARRVAHASAPKNPWWITERLIPLAAMAAAVCGVQALSAPPAGITALVTGSGFLSMLLLIGWPGLFSIGFAFFAAIARAAIASERSP